jgi:hypothetical protein
MHRVMTQRKDTQSRHLASRRGETVPLLERLLICILTFLVFAAIGIVVRIMMGPIPLVPIGDLAWAILPWSLAPGLASAALAAKFPRVFRPIAWLFPDVG